MHQLNWTTDQVDEFLSNIENEIPGDFEESTEDLNTSSDFDGWTMNDVAMAAMYANVDFHLPGFDRPKRNETAIESSSVARKNFHRYLTKYRPIGWSHYDMEDISQDLERLFELDDRVILNQIHADVSSDSLENELCQHQQKLDKVRRKLNFD